MCGIDGCVQVCEHVVWREAGKAAVLTAGEGLEKYVMSKIHARAFHGDTQRDLSFRSLLAALKAIKPEQMDVPVAVQPAGRSHARRLLSRCHALLILRMGSVMLGS